MSLEFIDVKDAGGITRKVAVDDLGSALLAQVFKLAFGSNGVATMVDTTNRLPVAVQGAQRAVSIIRPTNAATIAAGAKRVSFANVGAGSGTVDGAVLLPGETVSPQVDGADTLDAIDYSAVGTEFLIVEVR